MIPSEEWAQKYRPRRFEEVHSQDEAVRVLVKLVLGPTRDGVILHGPTGVGKSTLAEIFAKALLCERPVPSGSPCMTCRSCTQFDKGDHPDFRVYGALRQSATEFRELANGRLASAPVLSERLVVQFDELACSEEAYSVLNRALDDQRYKKIFIFTLIDLDSVSAPLQARMRPLALKPAEPSSMTMYLADVCKRAGLAIEDDTLLLLAETTESYRLATNDLQTLADGGVITAARVHHEVLGPRYGWLADYLEAAAGGDLARQLEILGRPEPGPEQKAELVLGLCNALKLQFIGPTLVSGSSRRSQITEQQAIVVVEAFQAVAAKRGVRLFALWDGVLNFWSQRPRYMTREILRAHAIRFNDWLHAEPALARPSALGVTGRAALGASLPASARPRSRLRPAKSGAGAGTQLTQAQAYEIYEAASFALQAYGAAFNLTLRLNWDARPVRSDAEIAKRAGEFAHQLQMRLRGWGFADVGGFHYILLHERRTNGRMVTTLVAHVPTRHVSSAWAWLGKQAANSGWGVRLQIEPEQAPEPVNRIEAARRHWKSVRELWRGVSPDLRADDARALVDVLGIASNRRRAAGKVACRRFAISVGLARGARARAAETLFAHRSAWAARAWDALFTGWEWGEHGLRERERRFLEAKRAVLQRAPRNVGAWSAEVAEAEFLREKQKQIYRLSFRADPWEAAARSDASRAADESEIEP